MTEQYGDRSQESGARRNANKHDSIRPLELTLFNFWIITKLRSQKLSLAKTWFDKFTTLSLVEGQKDYLHHREHPSTGSGQAEDTEASPWLEFRVPSFESRGKALNAKNAKKNPPPLMGGVSHAIRVTTSNPPSSRGRKNSVKSDNNRQRNAKKKYFGFCPSTSLWALSLSKGTLDFGLIFT